MAPSRAPETINRLVALFRADDLKTWDGPEVSGDYAPAVHVGYDGDPDGEFEAVVPNQEWVGLGAKRRGEDFDVVCCAVALTGNSDVKTARDTVYAMLATVENRLRADPSLGLTPTPFTAEFMPGSVFTEPTGNGYQVRGLFNVHVKTRI